MGYVTVSTNLKLQDCWASFVRNGNGKLKAHEFLQVEALLRRTFQPPNQEDAFEGLAVVTLDERRADGYWR
eukprot:SAG31_NODE_5213_length_2673_cov_2.142191_2_plen_71_part_00